MIEIIEDGLPIFRREVAQCPVCQCKFKYGAIDISDDGHIKCPWCGERFELLKPILPSDTVTVSMPRDCAHCEWGKKMSSMKEVYVGDSPCDWCPNRQVTV